MTYWFARCDVCGCAYNGAGARPVRCPCGMPYPRELRSEYTFVRLLIIGIAAAAVIHAIVGLIMTYE